jgi:hypothetical protein
MACSGVTPCLTADKNGVVPGARPQRQGEGKKEAALCPGITSENQREILEDDAQGTPSQHGLRAREDGLRTLGSLHKTYLMQ